MEGLFFVLGARMDKPFRGRFDAKLDPKGRLSLPKTLLSCISENQSDIVITNSQFKGQRNLDVYTFSEWQKLEERISKMSPLKTEVQEFRRFYLASGVVLSPDSQRRVIIPANLRRYAGIQSEAVLVGMGNKLEIWSHEVWESLFSQLASNFDQTLAAVAALDEGE